MTRDRLPDDLAAEFTRVECEGRLVRLIASGGKRYVIALDLAAVAVGRYAKLAARDGYLALHTYRRRFFEEVADQSASPWKTTKRAWIVEQSAWHEFLVGTGVTDIRASAIVEEMDRLMALARWSAGPHDRSRSGQIDPKDARALRQIIEDQRRQIASMERLIRPSDRY